MIKKTVGLTYKVARRLAVAVVGVTVLVVGVVMIVTPGPAIILIPAGLAILSIEFAWARYWLRHVRRKISGNSAAQLDARAEGHRDRVGR